MAELDKKIQKSQTDLVQAVQEAQEKRNPERVDMLVTNAIKQLKMSRFKPDLTTCLSLIYLARTNSKIFHQSSAIKELLKSMLRRDNGPANIKGKSDIVLPVLSANILIACCDTNEVRTLILNKIEQWLGSNSKASDMVQQLLATLCMKCQGDKQTIAFLVEIRQHWLQYLEDNFDAYGPVPEDLCASVRKLLHSDTSCESLIMYLKFLIKHDSNIDGLSSEVSRFIIERPISFENMLKEKESGPQLNRMILKIYIKLFTFLKNLPSDRVEQSPNLIVKMDIDSVDSKPAEATNTTATPKQEPTNVVIKLEPKDPDEKPTIDTKKTCIKDEKPQQPLLQEANKTTIFEASPGKKEPTDAAKAPQKSSDDENSTETKLVKSLYVKLPDNNKVITMSQMTIEAVLILLAMVNEMGEQSLEEIEELMNCWISESKIQQTATIFEDQFLTTLYDLPERLRQKLVQSSNDLLVDLGLHGASIRQMVKLLQLFGSPLTTINKILKRLENTKEIESIRSEIKDYSYFNQLIDFYSQMGASGAGELHKRLEQAVV